MTCYGQNKRHCSIEHWEIVRTNVKMQIKTVCVRDWDRKEEGRLRCSTTSVRCSGRVVRSERCPEEARSRMPVGVRWRAPQIRPEWPGRPGRGCSGRESGRRTRRPPWRRYRSSRARRRRRTPALADGPCGGSTTCCRSGDHLVVFCEQCSRAKGSLRARGAPDGRRRARARRVACWSCDRSDGRAGDRTRIRARSTTIGRTRSKTELSGRSKRV